ncbi:hypothetical protein PV417_32100 [Streptomyces sp. ME19-03-3]|nr:hypothetical protein [Streptomyces sp. ME19-03-3]
MEGAAGAAGAEASGRAGGATGPAVGEDDVAAPLIRCRRISSRTAATASSETRSSATFALKSRARRRLAVRVAPLRLFFLGQPVGELVPDVLRREGLLHEAARDEHLVGTRVAAVGDHLVAERLAIDLGVGSVLFVQEGHEGPL